MILVIWGFILLLFHYFFKKIYEKIFGSGLNIKVFPNEVVVVVGGGIAGCGCAYALKESGKDVILFEERSELGGHAKTFNW